MNYVHTRYMSHAVHANQSAVNLAISLLTRVRQAEDDNLERFPENFQESDAFTNAEFSLDYVTDAIENLTYAY